jgi:hypothetical protein
VEFALVDVITSLGGWLTSVDPLTAAVCTAAENLPCRPLTLECLMAAAGALPAGYAATTPLPPWLGGGTAGDRYDEHPTPGGPRDYAPEPGPGDQPQPPRQSPQDALSDEGLRSAQEDWARRNSDRFPTIRDDGNAGSSFADTLVQSIRNSGNRR